jgi:hypothetical protein
MVRSPSVVFRNHGIKAPADGADQLVVRRQTQRKDQRVKKPLYERLGVEELILFDPFEEYLQPQLQGYRQSWGRYQPIVADADGSVLSRTTSLRFKPEGKRLRMVDAVTGEPLLWSEDLEAARWKEVAARRAAEATAAKEMAARQAAETRADEETAARHEAEKRLRALEKELERLRKA